MIAGAYGAVYFTASVCDHNFISFSKKLLISCLQKICSKHPWQYSTKCHTDQYCYHLWVLYIGDWQWLNIPLLPN